MSKQLIIPCSRMVLVLDEGDLINGLKPEALERGIRQGKGYKRVATCEKRQVQVDRWTVYEMLKQNPKYLTPENIQAVESMGITELREGCIEFLLTKLRKGGCQY